MPSRPTLKRLLIANRGEIAVRISASAAEAGIRTVAVFAEDDADSRHVRRADENCALPGRGPRAYLDAAAMVRAAVERGCDAVHPGYGFLSEQAEFARLCEAAGLVFVGPTPAQLALFGDKLAARRLAEKRGVPVLEGTGPLAGPAHAEAFRQSLGSDAAIILKAAAGGGGRGMAIVDPAADLRSAMERASAEAKAAFGDGTLFAERYLPAARHIEVQIVGDGQGAVRHVGERDCTLQRRHQKLIEIAPAPGLDAGLREALLAASARLAQAAAYRSLGTFEFLIDTSTGAFHFIEANPRLQVEHTVTEEIFGIDLVAFQLGLASGRTLDELGLPPDPRPNGIAVQLRINAETLAADGRAIPSSGVVSRYEPATGPGIRVDSGIATGARINPAYDSLLAKLIVHSRTGDPASALARAERTAADFAIAGVATSLPLLRAILRHPVVIAGAATTRFVEAHAGALLEQARTIQAHAQPDLALPAEAAAPTAAAPPGTVAVAAPLTGLVVAIEARPGDRVRRGQEAAILEAMKMQHAVKAAVSGIVVAVPAAVGDTVKEGAPILFIKEAGEEAEGAESADAVDLDLIRPDLEEVRRRHAFGYDENRPEAVAKRRAANQRTARENVADLCDPGSFREYGALAIAAQRGRRSLDDLIRNTPADGLIAGFGTVNAHLFGPEAARCAVLAYDYTVLAGTQGAMNHKKTDRLLEVAHEWKTPVVFFTEGGGGRPGDVDTDNLIVSALDIMTFHTWGRMNGRAPRIAVNSGRCFAGNAVIFGLADVTIATKNSNIGLGGPAMIEGGGLGRFAPDEIGPAADLSRNGVVDLLVEDEAEAVAAAKRLLGLFQGATEDWACADQLLLRHLVPQNRLRAYDIRQAILALADQDSVLELRREYGPGLVTAFIRIEGEPFGLIANDPRHLGGAIDSAGGEKGGRFLQLCDAYGLPVVSLCDTPGFMVGPDSESTGAARRGVRLLAAGATLGVPIFGVVLRKGYGLGAQAMVGGSFRRPVFTIAWPTAEFGMMGLEGSVRLGFRRELEAEPDPQRRQALFDQILGRLYERGKAISVASHLEIDAVIDPAETRAWLIRGLHTVGRPSRGRSFVDVW